MLETAHLDVRSKPLAAPDLERRYRQLRRALVRRLGLAGRMTIRQAEVVNRASRLTLLAERAVVDGTPIDLLVRIDRSAARARAEVDKLIVRKLAPSSSAPSLADMVSRARDRQVRP